MSRTPWMPRTPPSSPLCGGACRGQHPGPEGGAGGAESEKGKQQSTGVQGSKENFTHLRGCGRFPLFSRQDLLRSVSIHPFRRPA